VGPALAAGGAGHYVRNSMRMSPPRSLRISLLLAAAVIAAAAGCRGAMQPLPELAGGVEVGLRRGASWSTLSVKPPYVIGPRVTLHLKKDVFTGTIDGSPVNLQVEADGIKGQGPAGQVSIDINDSPDKLVIEGSWNGQRAHFEITTDALRGSLAIYSSRRLGTSFYCQYVLDRTEQDARLGTSICNGLPEETRLEIPRPVLAFLTKPELVVVMLTLLSSPPFTSLETNG
jgi:hypothetical protein